ncbi:MAG: hypothetical protein ACFB9M_07340 [Myxococcota bacterium]
MRGLAFLLCLVACAADDVVGLVRSDAADLGSVDGQVEPVPGCDADEDLIRVDDSSCGTGPRFSMCVCGPSVFGQGLRTRASAAFLGRLTSEATVEIGGGLYAAGLGLSGTASANADRIVLQDDLQADGEVMAATGIVVDGDVRAARLAAPDGLIVSPNQIVDVAVLQAEVRERMLSLESPCECSARFLDFGRATAVSELESRADPSPFQLPCGALTAGRVDAPNGASWSVPGWTQLFVEGDVAIQGSFDVVVGPDGHLDLVIGGTLVGAGTLRLGEEEGQVDVQVRGEGTVQLSSGGWVSGHFDAPRAELVVSAPFEVGGVLRARSVSASALVVAAGSPAFTPSESGCGEGLDCCPPETCRSARCTSD